MSNIYKPSDNVKYDAIADLIKAASDYIHFDVCERKEFKKEMNEKFEKERELDKALAKVRDLYDDVL